MKTKGAIERLPSGRYRARKKDPRTGRYRSVGTFDTEIEATMALTSFDAPAVEDVVAGAPVALPTWWWRVDGLANVGVHGLVYVLAAADSGRIKIGFSRDGATIERRLVDIRSLSPSSVSVVGMVLGSMALERRLHHELRASRHHAEWYDWTPDVASAVAGLLRAPPKRREAA